jgi:DNA-binding response OmpR family regulator
MNSQIWTARDGHTLSILLLEDNEELTLTLKGFLESCSCKVTSLENGAEGLRRIMVEDFDLVLCDMVMPTFPGDKFYLAVERVKPALCRRFLFMTGHRAETQYETFIQEIGGLMLWKPFWPHELLAAIQSVLRSADELDVAEWSKVLSNSRGRGGTGDPPVPVGDVSV